MNGKLVAAVILISAFATGAFVWWTQEYAYYHQVAFAPGEGIRLLATASGQPELIPVTGIQAIDAESSPLRFRACFTPAQSQAVLSAVYLGYPRPEPTIAPRWFDCFDAEAIGQALARGEARAFLSEADIAPGIDRVVAVFADGRAYAWHQVNPKAASREPSAVDQ
jgi:hypothetical protein